MMSELASIRREVKRGCGYRKPGGVYLVSDGVGAPCGKLPLELTVCPTCGHGIKPARGWTWVNPRELFGEGPCDTRSCGGCVLSGDVPTKAGLIWIGHTYYPTPKDWIREGFHFGFSRKLKGIPKGFKLGETLVLAAHRKAITRTRMVPAADPGLNIEVPEEYHVPGIFHVWRPTRIEKVVKGDESEEELERWIKRGITPVHVIRAD